MRVAVLISAAVLLLACAAPGAAAGQPAEGAADRLKKVSPEEKARLAERLARWKAMSEDQKTRLRERLQSFRTLPEEEKAQIAQRAEDWGKKAPERKGEIERRLDTWLGFSGLRKDALIQRFKALTALPEGERRRLFALPDPQRTAEFQRIFLLHEVKRLSSRLSPEERRALDGLDPARQKEKALAILREKRAAQLARLPEAVRRGWEDLPPEDRAKAEDRALKDLAFRDQKILAVLPPEGRAEFLKAPLERRDVIAVRFLASRVAEHLDSLPAAERRAIEEADRAEKPWKLLDALFARAMRRVVASLLPSQQRALKDLPPAKQWERARSFLQENHRRLLARIPPALRKEVEGLPADQQVRRIRAWLEEEMKGHNLGRRPRGGLQELPLLLLLDALQRLKKEAPRDGKRKN